MKAWPYIVGVDCETSGLDYRKENIIELGGVVMDFSGNYISEFSSFCNPGKPIPEVATRINNITNEMVKDFPSPEVVLKSFFDWVTINTNDLDPIFVFHNAPFDARFLLNTAKKGNIIHKNYNIVDTLTWTKKIPFYKECENYKLTYLSEFIGYKPEQSHRACDDAKAALELAKHNIKILKNDGVDKLYKMYNLLFNISTPINRYGDETLNVKKYRRYKPRR